MATNRNLRFKTSRRFGVNIYGHPKALKRQVAETRQKKQSEYGVQLAFDDYAQKILRRIIFSSPSLGISIYRMNTQML